MMRRALLAFIALTALCGAASAQDASAFLGTWRDLPIERAAGQRVVFHHVEIAPRPTLRAPQQFNIHLWARCADNASAACDLGMVTGAARTLSDGSAGIFVEGSPRNGNALLPCRFGILFVQAYIAADPANPESRKRGVDYRITPPSGPCRVTQYHAATETIGSMDRMAALRPDALPVQPSLPRRP
jgi:hypothetical protein